MTRNIAARKGHESEDRLATHASCDYVGLHENRQSDAGQMARSEAGDVYLLPRP